MSEWYRYRPDLLDEKQNNVGSEGTGIHGEEGQPETDPRDQSDEPCRSCHAELTRLRAEVERLELRESVLMATVDKLETELQMWRGAADDRRGFVLRPKADPMF